MEGCERFFCFLSCAICGKSVFWLRGGSLPLSGYFAVIRSGYLPVSLTTAKYAATPSFYGCVTRQNVSMTTTTWKIEQ